jgi:hypothetical protein
MPLFRKHTRDATGFEAGQAFHFGVPFCEPAFEEDGFGGKWECHVGLKC